MLTRSVRCRSGRYHGLLMSARPTVLPAGDQPAALVVYRPLVRVVVAALGALLTHQFGYLIASVVPGQTGAPVTDHGHLSLQWALITPFAVLGAVGFLVWQLRNLGFRSVVSVRALTSLIIGLFLFQEAVETMVAGHGLVSLASNAALFVGVAVAPIVAWAIAKLLEGVTELAARFFESAPTITPSARLVPIPVLVRWSSRDRSRSTRSRAPPGSNS